MSRKINFFVWISAMFKEFISESASKSPHEIVDIFECPSTGFVKAVIKLSSSHAITKNISDIVTDNDLIEAFDKKTIRTLTYMATVEKMKPDYFVVAQRLGDEADDYIFEIKSRKNKKIIKKSLAEISKDKPLLSKINRHDAERIVYLSGVKDTVDEFKIKTN